MDKGYAFLGKLFTQEEVDKANDEIKRLLLVGSGRIICEPDNITVIRKIMNFCKHSSHLAGMMNKLGGMAANLFGLPAVLMVDNALLKPPRVGSASHWHQDQVILKTPACDKIYGFWVALEDTDLENGCMKVYPGTKGKIQHNTDDGWYIPEEKLPEGEPDSLEMKAGEVAVWNGLVVHGSGANKSDRSRWSLQYHFKASGAMPKMKGK